MVNSRREREMRRAPKTGCRAAAYGMRTASLTLEVAASPVPAMSEFHENSAANPVNHDNLRALSAYMSSCRRIDAMRRTNVEQPSAGLWPLTAIFRSGEHTAVSADYRGGCWLNGCVR